MRSSVLNTYAVYTLNEELRMQSSSGGIFSLLANRIISISGVIYGVTLAEDCKRAEYIRVTDLANLAKLRGSKYLQAKVGDTYKQVKTDIENGIVVLFTGTGCQVNGLRTFLGKDYDNLFCVDVICHGTPSPALWRKYVEHFEHANDVDELEFVNFRCKDYGWADYGMQKIDNTHKKFYTSKEKDAFMQMFLRNYCLRPSCYKCVAKDIKMSDVTIADFWGIEYVAPEMNDKKGTSLVLIRTEKGNRLFQQIKREVKLKEVLYDDGVKYNSSEYLSAARPVQRDTFFEDMNRMEFTLLSKKYLSEPLKSKVKRMIKKLLLKTPARKLILWERK